MKCIQCESHGCGWDTCRFSNISNTEYRRRIQAVNNYANAMSDRDRSVRNEGRPEHDVRCDGMPLKAGR